MTLNSDFIHLTALSTLLILYNSMCNDLFNLPSVLIMLGKAYIVQTNEIYCYSVSPFACIYVDP